MGVAQGPHGFFAKPARAAERERGTMAHSPPHVDEPGATSRLRKLCAAKDAQIEGLTSRVEVLSDDLHDLMRERDYLLNTCSQLEDCAHQCQEEAALQGERVASLEAELRTAGELQGRSSLPERRLSESAASGLEARVATLEAELKSAAHRAEAAAAAQARVEAELKPNHDPEPEPAPDPNQVRAEAELGAECARRFEAEQAQRDVGTATPIETLAEAQAMDTLARRNTALQAG